MDRLVNMILRKMMRLLVNKGVTAGINVAGRGGPPSHPQDKVMAKRQKQVARAARRISRM
ncbi:MAG: hypothetical protein AB8B58_02095 [Roseobacter sp.]